MKRFLSLVGAALCAAFLCVGVFASGESSSAAESGVFADRLQFAGSFFGQFLLVMGIIFVVLLMTKHIAAWIDKHKK